MKPLRLGVCYYPEHWPEEQWAADARRMAALGLKVVRLGEFAWSRLEPSRGKLDFDWLDRAIETLSIEGLKLVLGTPTATPPKWLVDEMPDMLAVGADGRARGFGSRRHYCFSHRGYRDECARIVTLLAKRYGHHPAVIAWQTDNEYGCHDTTLSYSDAARDAFRDWLGARYQSPDALNRAWGNVFWSMEYGSIGEIELPVGAVTELNPAHLMDFRRFASDEVVSFNRLQVDILRRHAPDHDILHNFMGRVLEFDHFAVGADLDISTWDSYPLGFLEDRSDRPAPFKRNFARVGDPDFQAFHHDLYRATSSGRWWVMEQQPGPVNWAPANPVPQPGMVRLWTWEAFAHGAELVSYFRWRQAPFGLEQMHAGLLRPDGVEAPGFHEAKAVADEIAALDLAGADLAATPASVALVFDYESAWAWSIQPQAEGFDYFRLVFDVYRALRRMGLSVDIVPPTTDDLSAWRLVVIPGLFAWTAALRKAVAKPTGLILIGPRSGSKTGAFSIPETLPPDLPAGLLDAAVTAVDSLRPDMAIETEHGSLTLWHEKLAVGANARIRLAADNGDPVWVEQGHLHYLSGWPDGTLADHMLRSLATEAGLPILDLPDHIRIRQFGALDAVFNHGDGDTDLKALGIDGEFLLGTGNLSPSGVALLRR
ncbi:MAG: beta-galactosidase [Pseudomonadota bacterium]